jgi:hypothetical protein
MHADVAGRMGAWWLRQFWTSCRGRLLVTTAALRKALERSTGMRFPNDAVQIAPNGVDLDRYQDLPGAEEARKQLQLPEELTIGFTGHFYAGAVSTVELPKTYRRSISVGGRNTGAVEMWREKLTCGTNGP